MKILYTIIFILITIFLFSLLFGMYNLFGGTKFVHTPEKKIELLKQYRGYIEEGYFVTDYPHYDSSWGKSWGMSINTGKISIIERFYNFNYNWSGYYRFKWFDKHKGLMDNDKRLIK